MHDPTIPVGQLVLERSGLALLITLTALLLSYLVAIPIGVNPATHQHSLLDHVSTFVALVGLAVPNSLLALALAYVPVITRLASSSAATRTVFSVSSPGTCTSSAWPIQR